MLHSTKSKIFRKYKLFFQYWQNVFAADWNGFAGGIRPVGRSLDTPALHYSDSHALALTNG